MISSVRSLSAQGLPQRIPSVLYPILDLISTASGQPIPPRGPIHSSRTAPF